MAILDSLGDGVSSSGGGGFTFSAVEIDTPGDNGWIATNLTGTNTFDNDSLIEDVDTSNRSAIRVQNTDTTLAGLTIENTPFQDGGSGQSVILIESFGASAFDKTPASLAAPSWTTRLKG